MVLISTTLDDRIPEDHPVRLFAELLSGSDWKAWESQYNQRIGQPPIHPRVLRDSGCTACSVASGRAGRGSCEPYVDPPRLCVDCEIPVAYATG